MKKKIKEIKKEIANDATQDNIKEDKKETAKEFIKENIKDSIDERSIIIEQDRLKREQKKQKNRKKKRIAIAVASFLAIGGVCYVYWGKNLQTTEDQNQVEIIAGVDEEIIFAQLNTVNGNEITYTIAEKGEDVAVTDSSEDETMRSPNGKNKGNRGGEMADGAGGFVQGEMPDMEGGFMMEGGAVLGSSITTTDGFTYNGATYNLTEEANTTYIPVGTDVTTKLGAVTTFSRLAAGDNVALVVTSDGEEQVILGIYIVG